MGLCSQGCVNGQGVYTCRCEANFELTHDNHTCLAIDKMDPLLVYATLDSIHGIWTKSNREFLIANKMDYVVGITGDDRSIVWTDISANTESILRSDPDGHNKRVIITSGISKPEDISIDWLTGNIYFTDTRENHIAVCTEDGYHCTIVFNDNMDKPRGIALYPLNGTMYWTDWGQRPMIGKAAMDGKQSQVFVSDNIIWPNGITLDWPGYRIYWVEAKLNRIESIRFDGSGRQVILSHLILHPFSIAVFEDTIFWSDWESKTIQSANKFTGKHRNVIVKDHKVNGSYQK